MAMNKHAISLVKATLLTLMLWWVFTSINFHDRITYKTDATSKDVVAEVVITIQGHWQRRPIEYTLNEYNRFCPIYQ